MAAGRCRSNGAWLESGGWAINVTLLAELEAMMCDVRELSAIKLTVP